MHCKGRSSIFKIFNKKSLKSLLCVSICVTVTNVRLQTCCIFPNIHIPMTLEKWNGIEIPAQLIMIKYQWILMHMSLGVCFESEVKHMFRHCFCAFGILGNPRIFGTIYNFLPVSLFLTHFLPQIQYSSRIITQLSWFKGKFSICICCFYGNNWKADWIKTIQWHYWHQVNSLVNKKLFITIHILIQSPNNLMKIFWTINWRWQERRADDNVKIITQETE